MKTDFIDLREPVRARQWRVAGACRQRRRRDPRLDALSSNFFSLSAKPERLVTDAPVLRAAVHRDDAHPGRGRADPSLQSPSHIDLL